MRIQQMAKALGLSGPWDRASAGASWIVFSTAFGASSMVLVVDNVPLGPDFGLAIDMALAGAACIGLWLAPGSGADPPQNNGDAARVGDVSLVWDFCFLALPSAR